MTYVEWYGLFQNWVQRVDRRGQADGLRRQVAPTTWDDPVGLSTWDAELVRSGNAFVAVWEQSPFGVRLRELSPRGVPEGEVVLVHPEGDCNRAVSAAVIDDVEAILYTEGCDQSDILMRTRTPEGGISDPIALADEPFDEGYWDTDIGHPMQAAARGTRLVVLYRVRLAGLPSPNLRWFLAEYDLDGNPTAPVRDLYEEVGLESYGEVDFVVDDRRRVYVIAWGGNGPSGPGVYYAALPFEP